jgi:hypothetical protein
MTVTHLLGDQASASFVGIRSECKKGALLGVQGFYGSEILIWDASSIVAARTCNNTNIIA